MKELRPSNEQRLTEVTAAFFRSKIGRSPKAVTVLQEARGDLLVIKVEGFLSQAETALSEDRENQRGLDEYYTRILGQFVPVLSQLVKEVEKRPLLGCRTVLDLARDECIYLLTLGEPAREGVPARTPEQGE